MKANAQVMNWRKMAYNLKQVLLVKDRVALHT
ncbi:hypothetical protein FOMG_06151 [Fusarium oxysporum f. sp. melonis 26406]|uniref:Uncharacterized protein n=1 Tax=Fusarium oxysporum f. sp. melonis 26406 TaxID=1089452 RepID=X0B051_FUSOX|nr:hypothetical protein FOMG_06151 [Fusarium oxysporum f. sp. melonis 26406]